MPPMLMKHDTDPRRTITDAMGDISKVEVFNNQLLVAIYIRPEKTKSGIWLPDTTRDEDKIQGKVGLVVKMGPQAFVDEDNKWFSGVKIEVGDWVYFRPSDGWSITINETLCRMIDDTLIPGRVDYPDRIW